MSAAARSRCFGVRHRSPRAAAIPRCWSVWLRVALPTLLPSILGTVSVLFANAIAAYATAYALLQNNFSLLPIRISEQFVGDVTQHKEFGSALSVVLMVLLILVSVVNSLLGRSRKGGDAK